MAQHRPEELLDEVRATFLVRVRKGVARGRGDAKAQERRGFEPQGIADVVKADGMRELGEEHRAEVAHHTEGAGLGVHTGLARMAVDHAERNEIEKLLEDDHIAPDWCLFVHTPLPGGRDLRSTPARFQPVLVKACGTAVNPNHQSSNGLTTPSPCIPVATCRTEYWTLAQ